MPEQNEDIYVYKIKADTTDAVNSINDLQKQLMVFDEEGSMQIFDTLNKVSSMLTGNNKAVPGLPLMSHTDGIGTIGDIPEVFQTYISSAMESVKNQLKQMVSVVGNDNSIAGGALTQVAKNTLHQMAGTLFANVDDMLSVAVNAKQGTNGLKDSVQKSLNHSLQDMLLRATEIIGDTYSSGLGAMEDEALKQVLKKHAAFSGASNATFKRANLDDKQQDALLNSLVKMSAPIYRTDYIRKLSQHSGGTVSMLDTLPEYTDFRERLPENLRRITLSPKTNYSTERNKKEYSGNLDQTQYDIVKKVAQNNPMFERALQMAGLAYRGVNGKNAGSLFLPSEAISKAEYAKALGYLYKDILIPSLEGAPQHYNPITTKDGSIQSKFANKSSKDIGNVFEAFSALQSIDVSPLFDDIAAAGKRNAAAFKNGSVALDNAKLSIKPNQYQIMSLTLDDFFNGNKPASDSKLQTIYEERARGTSAYKMIQQSIYTDLLGMFGDKTFGNGSKTDQGKPIILQIDPTKSVFKYDKDGEMEWDNGHPKENPEIVERIQKMFAPTETLRWKDKNGKEQEYHYPVVNNGAFGRYVPTNVKNGVITLAEEQAYLKATTESLQNTGVNVFDNLIAPGRVFQTYEQLNKELEARNRLLTPGVPIQSIGGRMPGNNQIAFIDTKGFKDKDGVPLLDGASFIMPGYIPGKNALVRAPAVKGQMQTVDFKQMIKDIYGEDTTEFFMPFMNAPKEMKELFEEKGIEAVKKAYADNGKKEDFKKDFLNIMDYEAIVSDSMLKSGTYRDLATNEDVQNFFGNQLKTIGGLRITKTVQDFLTSQSSLGRQMSQMIYMSPEEALANNKKWDDYINNLQRDPSFAVEKLFSDKNNPLHAEIQNNPAMIWSHPLARKELMSAIESARMSQMYGEIFGDGDLSMGLASINPAESIMRFGQMNGLKISNNDLAKKLTLSDGDISFGKTIGLKQIAGGRWPASWTEQFWLNQVDDYLTYADKYGMTKDAIYTNMKTIAKMGGGDVDGDTIQLLKNQLAEMVFNSQETRKQQIGDYTPKDLKPDDITVNRSQNSKDFADLLYRQVAAQIELGIVSNASDALSQGNWNDKTWVKNTGVGGIDLRQLYDIDSTFMKTGVLGDWTKAASNARWMGKPFSSVFKNLVGIADSGDFEKIGDFSKVNFPSIYDAQTVSMLNSLKEHPISSDAVRTMINAQEILQNIPELLASDDPIRKAQGEFLQLNNSLMSSFFGRAQVLSSADENELAASLVHWKSSINAARKNGNLSDERKAEIDASEKEYNKQLARLNAERVLGINERNVKEQRGYHMLLDNAVPTNKPSPFEAAYTIADEQQRRWYDQASLRAALVSGANPVVIGATQQLAKNAEKATLMKKADTGWTNHGYSWTQLELFEQKPEEWFRRYVQGDWTNKRDTKETNFGKVFHSVAQMWGERRKRNNTDYGTADEYEKAALQLMMNDPLIYQHNFEPIGETQYNLPNIKEIKAYKDEDIQAFKQMMLNNKGLQLNQDQIKRFNNILASVRALPEFLRDEEILGVEVPVSPNFGMKKSDPSQRVPTNGSIDIHSRRNGQEIVSDLKATLDQGKDQILVYSTETNAKTGRTIAYNVEGQPLATREFNITPEEQQRALAQKMYDVDRIQRFAAAGGDMNLIHNGLFSQSDSAFDRIIQNRDYNAFQREKEKEEKEEKIYYEQKKEEDRLAAIEEMNSSTGIGIAKAIALQNDVTSYVVDLQQMDSKFRSIINKKDSSKANLGQWDLYKLQIGEFFNSRRKELENRYASEEQLTAIDDAKNSAEKNFDQALMISSYEDLKAFNENLSLKMTDPGIANLAKEFNSLKTSIDSSKSAYNNFKESLGEDSTKWSAEQTAAMQKSEEELKKQNELYEQYTGILKDNSSTYLSQEFSKLTGTPLDKKQSIENALTSKKIDMLKFKNGLSYLKDNGLITEDLFNEYTKKTNDFDFKKYKKELEQQQKAYEDQRKAQADLRNAQYAMQADRYQNQVDRSIMQWNMRGNTDAISRNYMQRYGMYDQLRNERMALDYQKQQEEARRDHAQSILDNSGSHTAEEIKMAQADVASATANISKYEAALNQAAEAMDQFKTKGSEFSVGMNMLKASVDTVTQAADRMLQQFGRKLLQQAFTEAKNFVVQFDGQMRTIQAITMKTDEEMEAVRAKTIDRAIELRTSVSNVATVEGDLYRQGLDDTQVEERTEAIIKFATVTGAKVTDAGKAITTAIQNGLVDSAEQAMDVLTALGDSAATTANEIFKGVQKSAAAAKVAGVSYNQLNAMLTIGTSKTQMSGQVIGTAMQTIFSRMNRVTNKGYVNDETGASVSINDVEKALSGAGVQLREGGGKSFRNSFDVLRDLSKVWGSLNDIQRNNITYTMAGGRQTNVFQTLMEGMAEDGGAELDRLLGLAENSEGTTDSKYAIAVKSITAAMEELKTTYDGLVESMSANGIFQIGIEAATGFVGGLKDLTSAAPPAVAAITAIMAAVSALAVKLLVAKTITTGSSGLISTLVALGTLGAVLGGAGWIGSIVKDNQDANDPKVQAEARTKLANDYYESRQKAIKPLQKQIDEVNKYGEAWEKADGKMSTESVDKFNTSIVKLNDSLKKMGVGFKDSEASIENWQNLVEKGQQHVNTLARDAEVGTRILNYSSYKQTHDFSDLQELEDNAQHPAEHKNDFDIRKLQPGFDDYLLEYNDVYSISNVSDAFAKLYRNEEFKDLISPKFKDDVITAQGKEEYYDMYQKALMSLVGIDVYADDLQQQYMNYISHPMGIKFLNGINGEAKAHIAGPDSNVFGVFKYLKDNEQLQFLESFRNFLNSDAEKSVTTANEVKLKQSREDIIDEVIGVASTNFLTGGDENIQKYLRDKIIEKTKDVRIEDLADQANAALLDLYTEYGDNPKQFLEDVKKENNHYKYFYTDENGKQLFGFDDLDKAEEAYRNYKQSIIQKTSDIIELNYDDFDINRIKTSAGLNAYRNLDQFVNDYSLNDKEYTDVYKNVLSYAMQASSYQDMADMISNVEKQIPNLTGVMTNDAEFAKMIKDLKAGTGKYTLDQFRDYLQGKVLQSSLTDYTASILSGNMSYGQELAAYNAINAGTASADQYDLIAKQWGVNRTNFDANRGLYMTLENSRLNKAREESAHGFNVYMQDLLGGFVKSMDEEEWNKLRKENKGLDFTDKIMELYANSIRDESARQEFQQFMQAAKSAGYRTTIGQNKQFSTIYTGGGYVEENPLAANGNNFYTPTQIRGAAQSIVSLGLNADQAKKQYGKYLNEIKSSYPELYEWINTTDSARKRELETELTLKFKTEGINEVIKAGTLISNLAEIVEKFSKGGVGAHDAQIEFNKELETIRNQAVAGQYASQLISNGIAWGNIPPEYRDLIKAGSTTYASKTDNEFYGNEAAAAREFVDYLNGSAYNQALLNTFGAAVGNGLMTQEQLRGYGFENGQFNSGWFNSVNYNRPNAAFDINQASMATTEEQAQKLVLKAAAQLNSGNFNVQLTEDELAAITSVYGQDVANAITTLNSSKITADRNNASDILKTAGLRLRERNGQVSDGLTNMVIQALSEGHGSAQTTSREALRDKMVQNINDVYDRVAAYNTISQYINNGAELNAIDEDLFSLTGINKNDFMNADVTHRNLMMTRASADLNARLLQAQNDAAYSYDYLGAQYGTPILDAAMNKLGLNARYSDYSGAYGLFDRKTLSDLSGLTYKNRSLYNPYEAMQSENSQYELANKLYGLISSNQFATPQAFGEYIENNLTPAEQAIWQNNSSSGILSNIYTMSGLIGNREADEYQLAETEYRKAYNTRNLNRLQALSRITSDQAGWITGLYGTDDEIKTATEGINNWVSTIQQMSDIQEKSYDFAEAQSFIESMKSFSGFDKEVTADNWDDLKLSVGEELIRQNQYLPAFISLLNAANSDVGSDVMSGLGLSFDENGNLVGKNGESLLQGLWYDNWKNLYNTSGVFSNASNRAMIKDVLDNNMSLQQAGEKYLGQLGQSSELLRYLQLIEKQNNGETVDQKELDDLKKKAQESFTDNPFVGYTPQMTTAKTLEEISKLMEAGDGAKDMFAGLEDDIQSQLKSFPGLFDYLATYGSDSEAAAKAAKTLADAIRNEVIGALEEEGKVLSGLSNQLTTIANGNIIDSISQMNQLGQQITNLDEVQQAYKRLTSGQGIQRPEDWNTIKNAFNIGDNVIAQYQSGERSLANDYGYAMEEVEKLRNATVSTAVDQILVDQLGDAAYETKQPEGFLERIKVMLGMSKPGRTQKSTSDMITGMTDAQVAEVNQRLRASQLGEIVRGENGQWQMQYGGKADAQLTWAQQLARALDTRAALGQGDQSTDYQAMLNSFELSNGNLGDFRSYVDLVQRTNGYKTTAATDLLSNTDFLAAIERGDVDAIRAMLLNGAYGITAPNATRMTTSGVSEYITAALNGDKAKLEELRKNNPTMLDYLTNNVQGFNEAYSAVMSGQQLEKYQIDALKAGSAYQTVYERERNGELKAGSAELAQRLADIDRTKGPTREERRLISAEGSELQRTSQAAQIAQTMYDNQANLTETDWEYLQTKAQLTDEEIKEYKKTPEKLKDLAKDLKGDQQKIRDSLEAAIVGAFPELSSLSDLAKDGNQKIRELVEQLLDMSGLQLTEKDGQITGISEITDNRTAYEILTQGAAANVEPEKEAETYKNRLARLAMQSSDQESLIAAINSDAELLDYLKKDEGARMLGSGFDEIFYNSEHGWTYDQMRNALIQGTGYAPLYRDQLFNNNMEIARQQFGEGFGTSSSLNLNTEQLATVQSYIASHEDFAQWLSDIEGGADLLYAIGNATEDFTYDMTALNGEFSARKIEQYNKFNKASKDIASGVRALSGDIKDSNAYMKSFRQGINAIANNQYYREKYKKGDRSNDVLSAIAQGTGLDKKDLRKGGTPVQQAIKDWETEDKQAIDNYLNTAGTMLTEGLQGTFNEKLQNLGLDGSQIQLLVDKGQVTVDLSQLANEATGAAQAQIQEIMATLSRMGMQATGVVTSDGSNIKLQFQTTDLGKGRSGGGGGGGGGGKSAAQKLLERLKREQALLNHEIKMIQYQETKYENASEIGNQNRMIELENDAQKRLIATLEKHIETTKKQMARTKKNSDDWKSLYDSVLAYEEAIEEANIAIQENTKKIEENEQAILKLHTDLETEVDTEINNRIQRERDMLAGTVSMQDAIIEAIRARYRAEWALIEKDIEKKRAALEEEKNLIDERLQRRKDAEDEAEKYEELSEYKKQLALIEMDSTRTKDAAKLREQIAKIEKEIAWDVAEDEADYQKEQIDSQLQAYDDFVNYGGEDLEAWLEDANNLADEVNQVMQMSQEGMLDWLKANVEEYGLAMDAAQKQMIQGWIDTYEQMIGYTHTYWEEIADILSGKDLFLNYMMASQDYINASEDEQKQMLYDWGEMYDNWIAAQKRDAVYSHSDNGLSGIGTNGSSKKSGSGSGSGNNANTTTDADRINVQDNNGAYVDNSRALHYDTASSGTDKIGSTSKVAQTISATANKLADNIKKLFGFDSGGLVDFTGPAWVDGTKAKPEAFLSADDTALIRSFLDEAKVVRYRSTISNIDSNSFSGNSQNIGELVINITEAQFKDDADFDEVAQRVGQKFVKELSKQGFNTMSYSF